MRRLAGEVVSNGHLLPLLGVFQKLNSTRVMGP